MRIAISNSITGLSYAAIATASLEQSIRSLFDNGEEGAWYDPSDLTTLYQDAAGTTPVTGAGQPVGLMLDKSKGLTLGPELVTNGTFDTDVSGWTAYNNATTSVSSGQVTVTNDFADNGRISQAITCSVGSWYVVSADFVSKDSAVNAASVRIHTAPDGNSATAQVSSTDNTPKTMSLHFVATAATMYVQLITNDSDNFVSTTWDNISVRELPGNHATQSTSTARPTLQLSGSSYYLDFDGVDDWMSAAFASAQTQPNTLSVAFKVESTALNYRRIIESPTLGARHIIEYDFTSSPSELNAFAGTRSSAIEENPSLDDHVATVIFNTSASTGRFDGVEKSTTLNVGTNQWSGVRLSGSISTSGADLDGRIYGFVGVSRTLDPDEITNVESYLADKTGAFAAPVITGVPTISVS